MPAPRFFRFAYRLAAYDGMLTRRVEAQRDRDRAQAPAPGSGSPKPAAAQAKPRASTTARPAVRPKHLANAEVVPVGAMAMAFPGLIERTRVHPDLAELARGPAAADDGAAPPAEAPPTES